VIVADELQPGHDLETDFDAAFWLCSCRVDTRHQWRCVERLDLCGFERDGDAVEVRILWVTHKSSPFSSPMKALVKSASDGRIKILSLRLPAIAERSSPATRQSTIAKRAPGLASNGRRSGKYRFAGPAGTRSRSPADLVVSPCILSLSSPHACGVFELHFSCAVHSEPGHSPIGARHGTRHTL
jgi:hypothetical protein